MNTAVPYIIQEKNITLFINDVVHTIHSSQFGYDKVLNYIKNGEWDKVDDFINPKKIIINQGQGNIEIQGDKVFWKGKEFHSSLNKRLVKLFADGFGIEPIVLFLENLKENPSNRAVEELYGFLEKNNLPITPDGHFLAYKKVTKDYKDIYTKTIDNSVGQIVTMERNEVDDRSENTCSHGLHFCSKEYLNSFGETNSRTMVLKIHPKDCVSFPKDYNNSKGRCCRYEVIAEIDKPVEEESLHEVA
jgi:hypothetical protein